MRQAERTPPATVFGMSNILRSSMTLKPISLSFLTTAGPSWVKSSRPTFIQIGQPRRDSAVARASSALV